MFSYTDLKGLPMGGTINNLNRLLNNPDITIKEGDIFEFEMDGMEMKAVRLLNNLSDVERNEILSRILKAKTRRSSI